MGLSSMVSRFWSQTPMSKTIGAVIEQKKSSEKVAAAAQAASEAAQQAYSDAQHALAVAEAELKASLAKTGPAFLQEADGSIEVYLPEASEVGYHILKPVAVATPIDPAPPVPVPLPVPAPAPAS